MKKSEWWEDDEEEEEDEEESSWWSDLKEKFKTSPFKYRKVIN